MNNTLHCCSVLLSDLSCTVATTTAAGAAMFRLDTALRLDKTFALRLMDKDPTLASARTKELDGHFFKNFASTPDTTNVILRRTLMMHL
jgi:hypothetical protein